MATTVVEPRNPVADAIAKISTISTLPEVTSQIVATVENPKSTASQLHKIVSHDPALVSRILKVVNSAFYGLPGQVASVERAIVLLGLNAVKNIAVAASLGQLFRGVKLCEGFTAKDLWAHCIAVAVAARDISKQMKCPMAEEAFLAGLIHDLGILVSLQVQPEKLRAVCERVRLDGGDFCEVERQLTGMDHQQLGQALAEQWKFPRLCREVAGQHHQPWQAGEQDRLIVSIVYAADTLCCQSKHGFNLTGLHQTLDDERLGACRIDPAILDRTRGDLDILVSNAMSALA